MRKREEWWQWGEFSYHKEKSPLCTFSCKKSIKSGCNNVMGFVLRLYFIYLKNVEVFIKTAPINFCGIQKERVYFCINILQQVWKSLTILVLVEDFHLPHSAGNATEKRRKKSGKFLEFVEQTSLTADEGPSWGRCPLGLLFGDREGWDGQKLIGAQCSGNKRGPDSWRSKGRSQKKHCLGLPEGRFWPL